MRSKFSIKSITFLLFLVSFVAVAQHTEQTDVQRDSEWVNFLPLCSHQEGRVRRKKKKRARLAVQTLMGNSSLSVLPWPTLPSPLCCCLPGLPCLFHAQTMKERGKKTMDSIYSLLAQHLWRTHPEPVHCLFIVTTRSRPRTFQNLNPLKQFIFTSF